MITTISDEMKLYFKSDLLKKLKSIKIYNDDELNHLFQYFLTPYIQIIHYCKGAINIPFLFQMNKKHIQKCLFMNKKGKNEHLG
jgi:hypothetical protein